MKLERIIYILLTILAKRQIKAKDIADRFQVSIRTIYRDIDTLSLAGVPIYSERGNQGGFYIPDDYKIQSSFIIDEEKQLLNNMSQMLASIMTENRFQSLEHKMLSILSTNNQTSHYYIDLTSWFLNKSNLDQLDMALQQQLVVSFDYVSKQKENTQRKLIPYHLIFKVNAWYILGYCLEKLDFRVFKLSRMRRLQLTSDTFSLDEYPQLSLASLNDFINPDRTKFSFQEIEVEFSRTALWRVYDHFTEDEIFESDNTIYVKAQRTIDQLLVEQLLSFGKNVKVLSPNHLQHLIIENIRKNLQQYDNTSSC